MSDILKHVHITSEGVASYELSPPHPPRVETPAYHRTHEYLVNKLDKPCVVCGVTKSTLADAAKNPCKAEDIETHHYPIERSLMDACDPDKVHKQFPLVVDRETLEQFIDSPLNMLVLCSIHHRSTELGIHHLLSQDFAVLPYLYDGYHIAATLEHKEEYEKCDDVIEIQHHQEDTVVQTKTNDTHVEVKSHVEATVTKIKSEDAA